MFDDGIYSVQFGVPADAVDSPGAGRQSNTSDLNFIVSSDSVCEALAILRDGRILGSDCCGGMFTGTCDFDPVAGHTLFKIRIVVPPAGELITGFAAGAGGATVEINVMFEGATLPAATTVELTGQPVKVEVAFLGPLPA